MQGAGTTTWSDYSGNAADAALTNGPAWIKDDGGAGVQFDGTNDYASFTRFTLLTGLTIAAWFKTTSTDATAGYTGNAAQNILGDNTNGVSSGFGVHNGKARYMNWTSGTNWQTFDSTASVNDGALHMALFTHAPDNSCFWWLDGALDRTGTVTYGTASPIAFNRVGAGYLNGSGNADYFTGTLYQVMVFPRSFGYAEARTLWNLFR